MLKNKLLEWKSVSDEVDELAIFVTQNIIKDSRNQRKKVSNVTYAKFVENSFQIKVSNFLKGGNILTVNYIMYYVDSQGAYDLLNGGKYGNCEADEETNTIKIVSAFINDKVANDLEEKISHELNHLYHYGQGMGKRKDLYDKTRDLLNLGKQNIDAYYIGLCCYYSFKHEQDAFAQQFYTFLMNNKPKGEFKDLLMLSDYKYMDKACQVINTINDNDEAMDAINYLGYSRRDFIKLIKYRKNRFYIKIRNVIRRYYEETQTINEHNIDSIIKREFRRIDEGEKYGYEIKWKTESIYVF